MKAYEMLVSEKFRYAFITAFASLLFMYGFELSHFTLSIDEDAFDNFYHTVELGRWGHSFLRNYILPEPFVPFYTMAISLLITSVSAGLIASHLSSDKYRSALFSMLFVSIPAFAYQYQFQNQADTFSIAVLLATLMAITFEGKGILRFIAFAALGVFSMSIYQSIILFPIAIILSKDLIESFNGKLSFKKGLIRIAKICVLMLLIYFIYSALTKIIQNYLGIPPSPYLSKSFSWGKAPFGDVLKNVLTYLWWRLSNNTHFSLGIYAICIIPVLIISTISMARQRYYCIFLTVCIYLFPFTLDILTGSWLPARTLTQLPVCFAILMAMVLWRVKPPVAMALTFILLTIGAASSNKMFYADYVSNKQDDDLSHQMISTLLNQYPEFSAKTDRVYFYGNSPIKNTWRPYNSENFGVSFFQYGDSRIVAYMNMRGYMNLKKVDKSVIDSQKVTIEQMPCWPRKNSIMKMENNYIIRYCSDSF